MSDIPGILECLVEGGADLVEIGIPFSDPFGEGPTIQMSSQRALDSGATPVGILEAVSKVKYDIPLVTMGYYNTVLRMGLNAYAEKSAHSGLKGTIINDLVPDEADDWDAACVKNDLETIYLVAPTSTEKRIDEVCARTTGFVYAVSRTGVTGAESAVPPEVGQLISRVRAKTSKPVCVGFGISKPEHVAMVCKTSDGAVVGSAIVSMLHKHWDGGKGASTIRSFVRELKSATQG